MGQGVPCCVEKVVQKGVFGVPATLPPARSRTVRYAAACALTHVPLRCRLRSRKFRYAAACRFKHVPPRCRLQVQARSSCTFRSHTHTRVLFRSLSLSFSFSLFPSLSLASTVAGSTCLTPYEAKGARISHFVYDCSPRPGPCNAPRMQITYNKFKWCNIWIQDVF